MPGPADAYIGEVLKGRYRLDEHLDDGNFSHVYRATDITSGQRWAVKLLTPSAATSPEAVVEFESEARLLRILEPCRNVLDLEVSDQATIMVSINSIVTPVSIRFHVLELADGAMADLLAHRHALPWHDRLALFRQIVAGVHQMHGHRVAHRDIKTSNALLFNSGSNQPVVKVSDLGRGCLTTEPPRFAIQQYLVGRGDLSFARRPNCFGSRGTTIRSTTDRLTFIWSAQCFSSWQQVKASPDSPFRTGRPRSSGLLLCRQCIGKQHFTLQQTR